jgi:hypothetical protein
MNTRHLISGHLIVLIIIFLLSKPVYAQSTLPVWKFAKATSGADIVDMQTDSVGNCYMTGYFNSDYFRYGNDSVAGRGFESMGTFIMKTDQTGKLLWLYSMYGSTIGSDVNPKKLKINEHGDAVCIVEASSTDLIKIGNDSATLLTEGIVSFIVKIAKNEQIQWIRQIASLPDTLTSSLKTEDVFIEESGTVFLTGYFHGENASISDGSNTFSASGNKFYSMLFLSRIESDGVIGWIQSLPIDTTIGSSNIYSNFIRDNPGNNSVYIGGSFDGMQYFMFGGDTLTFAMSRDAYIASFSKTGVSQWAVPIQGAQLEYPEGMVVMPGGDVVFLAHSNSTFLNLFGNIYSPDGAYNLYLTRFNQSGTYINSAEIAIQKPLINDPGFNAHLSCNESQDLIIVSEYQSAAVFSSVYTLLNAETGTNDMFIARMNGSTFNLLWTVSGSGQGDNHFEAVHIDRKGNIFFSGAAFNSLNLGPTTIPGNVDQATPYTARINESGVIDHVFWQSNTIDNQLRPQKIGTDAYGNTYVSGFYFGYDNVLGTAEIRELSQQGNYLSKYSYVKDLNGIVRNQFNEPLTEGYVRIYGFTFFQKSPLNDSVLLGSDGNFSFTDIPYGNYILVVQPIGEAGDQYSQTYFPSAVYWEFARQISLNNETPDEFYEIIVRETELFNGNTVVNGNLTDNLNTKNRFDKGRPVKKSKIILVGNNRKDNNYDIITTVETDEFGNFSFNNIENGIYYIWVDIPGLPVEDVYEITINNHMYISNLDYIVTEELIARAGIPEYSSIDNELSDNNILLFPNPSNNLVCISMDDMSQGVFDFIDAQGMVVKHIKSSTQDNMIDISELLPGNYTVRILTEEKLSFKKLTVIK